MIQATGVAEQHEGGWGEALLEQRARALLAVRVGFLGGEAHQQAVFLAVLLHIAHEVGDGLRSVHSLHTGLPVQLFRQLLHLLLARHLVSWGLMLKLYKKKISKIGYKLVQNECLVTINQ